MEDLVIIEAKDYQQVIFEEIQDFYARNTNLNCSIIINDLLKINESDFVGIYKVGFKNLDEFLTCVPNKLFI